MEKEEPIRASKLGLNVGDILTYDDGQTCVRITSIGEFHILVKPNNPDQRSKKLPPCTQSLSRFTYLLTNNKKISHNECLSLWQFNKKTLLQRYEELQNSPDDSGTVPLNIRRSMWVRNIRNDSTLFYTENCFRFLSLFFTAYKGTVEDRGLFGRIGDVMGGDKLVSLFYDCTTEEYRKDFERGEYGRIKTPQDEAPKDVLLALYKHPKSNARFRQKLLEWLAYAQKRLAFWQETNPDPVKGKFNELKTLLDLSSFEYDFLLSAVLLSNGILQCNDFMSSGYLSRENISKRAKLVGVTESAYLNVSKRQSKLRRLDCVDDELKLIGDIMPFINGLDDEPLANRYFKKDEGEPLPWKFFGSLGEMHGTLIKQMITGRSPDRGINILLYGEPGTGKTSFAQALARELGYTAYLIAQAKDLESEKNFKTFRLAAVQVCDIQVDPRKSIMIVDEADKILEGAGGGFFGRLQGEDTKMDKGAINDILDTLKTPCIWITNSQAYQLDTSNRRRFDYSIAFERLTHAQRRMIWKNAVTKYNVSETVTESMIELFASTYEVNAGGISLAVRNLADMLASGTATVADAESVLKGILKPHCKLLNIRDDTARMAVAQDYSLEGLNIKGSMKLEQIMSAVGRFQSEQATQTQGGTDRPRMNLLLSGPPGTGKTEFVKYLGASLNTRVVTRMGSDLLDMYVGGTEQNIKRAFEEASSEKAILFLDEIDGMIQSRERAQRSWEVTQVNELLHQMENFDGVLIGATNFVINLDPATLRRFTFKLEFDCLTNEGKEHFLLRMFNPMGVSQLSSSEQRRLQAIPNLTPGDFRTVRQSLYYLASTVTTDLILKGLERESLAKRQGQPQGRIGFG